MARAFMKKGYRVVSGGTDTHQVLIDLISKGISGKSAKNCLGSGAASARGMTAPQMQRIVEFMNAAMINQNNNEILKETSDETRNYVKHFLLTDLLDTFFVLLVLFATF